MLWQVSCFPDKGDTHLVIGQGYKMDSCYIYKETNITSFVSHLTGQVSCPQLSLTMYVPRVNVPLTDHLDESGIFEFHSCPLVLQTLVRGLWRYLSQTVRT